MAKLYLMASPHPELGVVFPTEQGFGMGSKDFHHFLPYRGTNQDLVNSSPLSLNLKQKEDWKFTGGLLDCNQFVKIDSIYKRHSLTDVQDTRPDSELLSLGIAERFARQETILKLLSTGSIQVGDDLLDLSTLYDLMRPQKIGDFPQEIFSNSKWVFNNTESDQSSLIYPAKEFYFNEVTHHPDGQYNRSANELSDILSVISEHYLSKNTIKSSTPTLLVPFFERRRRAKANVNASKLVTEKAAALKSHEKVKEKTSQKKNKTNTRIERDNSYLHACESLLSILFDKNHESKSTILSLKKSGPQLPRLLTQFSASIAGTGIAVVLSIICRVVCTRVPFCGSKLLSTGLGLGLLWLSWAVNKLRDTVVSITRSSGKSCGKEEEMMNHLERNLKDVYLRVAALMAVAVLRLV